MGRGRQKGCGTGGRAGLSKDVQLSPAFAAPNLWIHVRLGLRESPCVAARVNGRVLTLSIGH
jgi:hypothetical protein